MLDPAQRRAAVLLLGLMLLGMLLETLGVGAVVPVLTLITKGDLVSSYPSLAPLLELLGNPSHERLVVIAMLALLGVYVVKALFLIFLTWLQARFIAWINLDFSLRLFTGYLRQPYTFHLQRNSAELIRNGMGQVGQMAGAIQSYMLIIAESLVVLGILVLLLMVEGVSALLVTSILGLAGWGFYRFTKGYIKRWGEEYQGHEKLRLQYMSEGLGAAKEVKLLGREENFIDRYQASNLGRTEITKNITTLAALPPVLVRDIGGHWSNRNCYCHDCPE